MKNWPKLVRFPSIPALARLHVGRTLVLSLALGLAAVPRAQAEEPGFHPATSSTPDFSAPARDGSPATRWYGYQTALSDLGALGLVAGSIAMFKVCSFVDLDGAGSDSRAEHDACENRTSNQLALTGSSVYLLGAPIVHAANGHWDKAGLSLGLRALPVALAFGLPEVGAPEGVVPATVVLGAMAAMIVDNTWIAREDVTPKASAWYLASSVDVKSHAAHMTLVGSF